jgi:hypothetical protein
MPDHSCSAFSQRWPLLPGPLFYGQPGEADANYPFCARNINDAADANYYPDINASDNSKLYSEDYLRIYASSR